MVKNAQEMSDAAIMKVLQPPVIELMERENLIDQHEKRMPPIEAWRMQEKCGVVLNNNDHQVFCNHFKINTDKVPSTVMHYNVSIYFIQRDDSLHEDDLAKKTEKEKNTKIVDQLIRQQGWENIGSVYDGMTAFYTAAKLDFIDEENKNGNRFIKAVLLPGSKSARFKVSLTEVGTIHAPITGRHYGPGDAEPAASSSSSSSSSDEEGEVNVQPQALIAPTKGQPWVDAKHRHLLQALDTALLGFARWGIGTDDPSWIIAGAKAFSIKGVQHQLSASFVGMLGYYASLKICKAGLVLVADISYTAFLAGGDLISFFARMAGCRGGGKDWLRDVERSGKVNDSLMTAVLNELKGCRFTVTHINRTKKIRAFGPAANDPESGFSEGDEDEGNKITVADYFAKKAAEGNEKYRLQYPYLPTVDCGSKKRPMLIPMELCHIPPGQTRNKGVTGEISSQIIKQAAMAPNERMSFVTDTKSQNLFGNMMNDKNAEAFGLGSSISTSPMRLPGATILPPAKLQYGKNRIVEPQLSGTWNLAGGVQFAHKPPSYDNTNVYPYSLVFVYDRQEPRDWSRQVENWRGKLEEESRKLWGGSSLELVGRIKTSTTSKQSLEETALAIKRDNVRIVVVVLHFDCYSTVKMCFDREKLPTQCIKLKTTEKMATVTNIMMKVNMKLGGVNHTLARRDGGRDDGSPTFQSPPNSISWMFNEPCMVVGVDVNHPEDQIGGKAGGDSVSAVVASMDGMLGQYAAHVSTCASRKEPVDTLRAAMNALLERFAMKNNGDSPTRIIVYRDGVADNQFDEVVERELAAYQEAIDDRGLPANSVKISIVVCQKRHHTRLVYKSGESEDTFKNPCVGLCIDGNTGETKKKIADEDGDSDVKDLCDSIASSTLNDFYLNSHLAVLGTSKPCKYTLIYDEIGIKMQELELLTHWTTHLYMRCTRAVGYATPAYYAHWAARRGKALLQAGVRPEELKKMTNDWLKDEQEKAMYWM